MIHIYSAPVPLVILLGGILMNSRYLVLLNYRGVDDGEAFFWKGLVILKTIDLFIILMRLKKNYSFKLIIKRWNNILFIDQGLPNHQVLSI